MVVNFKVHEISRGTRKLAQTSTLIIKKQKKNNGVQLIAARHCATSLGFKSTIVESWIENFKLFGS